MAFEIVVIGVGRGGTTLVSSLLNAHPLLTVDNEYAAKATLVSNDEASTAARIEDFVAASERRAAKIDTRYGNKLTTEMLAYVIRCGARASESRDDVLDSLQRLLYADRLVVSVLRDGRTCVRSKMDRTGCTVEDAVRRWRLGLVVRRHLQASETLMHEVRYEDLVSSPQETLTSLCHFLGEEYSDEMLHGVGGSQMMAAYDSDTFDTTKLELTNIPAGCEALLRDGLIETGYLPGTVGG